MLIIREIINTRKIGGLTVNFNEDYKAISINSSTLGDK